MNTATKGKRGFRSDWSKQESGNIRRVFGKLNLKVIFRRRDDLFEVHAWDLTTNKHVFATMLHSRMIYWRSEGTPARLSLRSAKDIIRQQIDKVHEAVQ